MSPTNRFNISAKEAFLRCFAADSAEAQEKLLLEIELQEPELAEEVRGLLRDIAAGAIIDRVFVLAENPPELTAGRAGLDAAPESILLDISRHPTIDGYKLLEQIGQGGMGSVYMAQQTAPVKRKVALKVIKAGMDSKEVIARFEAERQALAMMDHPHIAKVLDGGTTPEGRPFFVMELVRGVPLTEFCNAKKLKLRERLKLFVNICQAVQHAHQKGIIHRDLKPSNLLVTLHDGIPVVKVIDFGVAKALNQELTERTLFTQFSQMIGTPLYMAPEQAEMSGLDVDTRSDIYSLGVVLYELLTGTTPFDRSSLAQLGLDDVRKLIKDHTPLRPSARVSTLKAADQPTVVNQKCPVTEENANKFKRELDWIVMKALEKDRSRRYESASAFAADVKRYLDDEPVVACPTSIVYRLRKFTRRHRGLLITVALVAASLLVGTLASLWQWRAAVDARLIAEASEELAEQRAIQADREALKAGRITELLSELLASANPVNENAAEFSVREMLDGFSVDLTERLKDQPEVEATIRATIGNAYAWLQVYDQAEEHLRRVVKLRRQGSDSGKIAEALNDLAWLLVETNPVESETIAREALEVHRKLQPDSDGVLRAMHIVQRALTKQNRFVESDAVAEELLRIARAGPSMERPSVAETLHNLSGSKRLQGDLEAAVRLGVEAVALHRRVSGERHPELAWALAHLSSAYLQLADYDAAEAATREAGLVFGGAYGSDSPLVVGNLSQLGEIQELLGHEDDAIETYRDVVSIFLKKQTENVFIGIHARSVAELAAFRLVRLLEDRNLDDEAATVYADVAPQTAMGFLARGQYHAQTGRDQKAFDDYLLALKTHPEHSTARRTLYDYCAAHNLFDEAIAAIDGFIEEAPSETALGQIRTQLLRERSKANK